MRTGVIRTIPLGLLLALCPIVALAQTDSVAVADTIKPADKTKKIALPEVPIYQGMTIKLELGAAVIALATSKAKLQDYEIAMNWRLKNRFYPTLELGYAGGTSSLGDSIAYRGHGGFFRVGCDINPLKKHPESPHALLVGVRLGTAVQGATHDLSGGTSVKYGTQADCWGEIIAGCQVNIVAGLYMGWMGRFKCLFTRKNGITADTMLPIYIPGYGNRDNVGWGASYHIGYHF